MICQLRKCSFQLIKFFFLYRYFFCFIHITAKQTYRQLKYRVINQVNDLRQFAISGVNNLLKNILKKKQQIKKYKYFK